MKDRLLTWLFNNGRKLFFALFALSAVFVGKILWQFELMTPLLEGDISQDLAAYFLFLVAITLIAALIALFIMMTVFIIILTFWFLLACASFYGIAAILTLAFNETIPVGIAAVSLFFLIPISALFVIQSYKSDFHI